VTRIELRHTVSSPLVAAVVSGGMRTWALLLAAALGACAGGTDKASGPPLREVGPNELRAPSDFAGIEDEAERSRALFVEAGRVLKHARCVNCHPAGDVPHQREALELHDPPVLRGPDDHGVVGMECTSCHQDQNQAHTRVPGAPKWALAPLEMAWVGKSLTHICEQLKDTKRNGGKTLAEIVQHTAHDPLVAWGWAPGADRQKAPGTQEQFGALFKAWMETGAQCPKEDER
jgi:hypothetical protein